ncbi:MAG: hypothetical protein NTV46_02880, partial [Verrucomicrobia bacterium]|nr:hypothetical protein [Verrucomicrobiota bacterium]
NNSGPEDGSPKMKPMRLNFFVPHPQTGDLRVAKLKRDPKLEELREASARAVTPGVVRTVGEALEMVEEKTLGKPGLKDATLEYYGHVFSTLRKTLPLVIQGSAWTEARAEKWWRDHPPGLFSWRRCINSQTQTLPFQLPLHFRVFGSGRISVCTPPAYSAEGAPHPRSVVMDLAIDEISQHSLAKELGQSTKTISRHEIEYGLKRLPARGKVVIYKKPTLGEWRIIRQRAAGAFHRTSKPKRCWVPNLERVEKTIRPHCNNLTDRLSHLVRLTLAQSIRLHMFDSDPDGTFRVSA